MSFFSPGNLITLAIVVIFFILYHRITSNNRSLDKVKRLGDRLKDELSSFVDTRAEDLKHFGIELDVQQKAAKVALEKLQSAQQAIAEKSDTIGAIADRFKEYDDILSKLMDMTKKVDENLAHVQEEGDFADTVNRKLDTAKKSVSAIERELPLLRETFAADAQKILDSFRDQILGELHDGLSSTTTELRSAREEAIQAFEKAQTARALVDGALQAALEAAALRAVSIEDSAFETLVNDSKAKAEALESDLDSKIESLANSTNGGLLEARNSLSAFKTQWQNELKANLERGKNESSEAFKTIDEKVKAAEQSASAALENVGTKAKAAEKTALGVLEEIKGKSEALERSNASALATSEALNASLSEKAAKATAELDRLISEKKSDFDALAQSLEQRFEAASSMEKSLVNAMEATKGKIEEEFANFGQAFEGHRTRFEENFSAETKELERAVQEMRGEVEALRKDAFSAAKERLAGFSGEVTLELESRRAEVFSRIDAWLSELDKTVQDITEEAANRRKKDEEALALEVRKEMAKIRDNLFQQLDRIQRDVQTMAEDAGPKGGSGESAT